MKNLIIFFGWVFILMSGTLYSARKSIAVVEFKETGSEIKGLNTMVRGNIESLLQKLGRLTLVERGEMEAILKEHELSLSGVVDDNTAIEYGGVLGVNFLLFGDIVQGTITAPVPKTRQNYKKDKVTGKKIPSTFTTWDEISAVTKINLKIINVKNGSIRFTESKSVRKVKSINKKTYKSKALYQKEMAKQKKLERAENIITLLTKQKKEVKPDNLGPVNKNLLSATLESNIFAFKRNLFFAFPLEGVIIKKMGKKIVMIDLGTEDGAKRKTKLEVFRLGEPVKHPTTGKLMENKEKLDGSLTIKEITGQNTCIAKGKKKLIALIKVGDSVVSRKQLIIPR